MSRAPTVTIGTDGERDKPWELRGHPLIVGCRFC